MTLFHLLIFFIFGGWGGGWGRDEIRRSVAPFLSAQTVLVNQQSLRQFPPIAITVTLDWIGAFRKNVLLNNQYKVK